MKITHEATGATFQAPDGWEVARTGETSMVIAVEPVDDDGAFRANLVLTAVDNGGRSFTQWQNGTEGMLPGELTDYLVIDLESFELDGRQAGSRLAHHVDAEGRALVVEQCFTAVGGVGYTVTATVDSLRYPVVADEMSTCCRSLRVPSGGAA